MNLTRANLRALAELRLKDASILLKNGAYSSAYYLAGYSVELGLKACVARQFRQDEIPDKQLINNVLSHDFTRLIGIAGLKTELARTQDEDQTFQSYWGIVGEWSSESRYDMTEAMSAQLLLQAIGETKHGVLRWIKLHW